MVSDMAVATGDASSDEVLRVLLLTEPSGGGSGRHVVDLARELAALGHQVSVIHSPLRAEPRFLREIAAIPLKALETTPMPRAVGPWDIDAAITLRRMIDRLGPFDIVHAHSSKAGALARLIGLRAAIIYTPHAFRTMDPTMGRPGRLVYGGIETLLAVLATRALIAVAPEEAAHARALGVAKWKIHTIVNGLTPAPKVDRPAARAELGLAPGDLAVGFVGRLCDQKDPVRFAAAIRIANSRDARMRGVILGDGELDAAVRAAGGDAVTVLSGLNAVEYLPALDLFAMTSRYEAMPYVLLEALQASLPIVSTQVGGASVALRDGQNGRLLPVDAPPDVIAEAVAACLESTRRAAMAQVSANMARTLTARAMAEATVAVYRKSLRRGQ